jgi:hypothetical protein
MILQWLARSGVRPVNGEVALIGATVAFSLAR